jgi:hypothetical protein
VPTDQETVVHVYNCTGEPGKPGDTPTKYPNTGVAPLVSELPVTGVGQVTTGDGNDRSIFGPLAGVVSILGLVGRLLFIRERVARQRGEREEGEAHEERAAREWQRDIGARLDRRAWLQSDASIDRTVRPARMNQEGAIHDSRPIWLTGTNRNAPTDRTDRS